MEAARCFSSRAFSPPLFERTRSGKGPGHRRSHAGRRFTAGGAHFRLSRRLGLWEDRRGSNLLNSGAPFYDTYETADGRHIAVGLPGATVLCRVREAFAARPGVSGAAIRPGLLGSHARGDLGPHQGKDARRMGSHLRAERCMRRAGAVSQRGQGPSAQQRARNLHLKTGTLCRPAPAPRFSRTRKAKPRCLSTFRRQQILTRCGFTAEESEALVGSGLFG